MARDQTRTGKIQKLEGKLDAGEWLSPGQVAELLGVSRSTAQRLFNNGEIGHRKKPGGYRYGNPEDVRRHLQAARTEYRGETADASES